MTKARLSKALKNIGKTFIWIVGIWIILLIILQITLSTGILTKIVNDYTARYIDGNMSFGKVSVSMFRKFPRAQLNFDDFSITYPAERYQDSKTLGAQGHLKKQGCGEKSDTLASFRSLSASVNILALAAGEIKIPHLDLNQPRIFIHNYADGRSNLDIFEFESDGDNTETNIPGITFGDISLSNSPHIVYTDSKDTVFAGIRSKHIQLNGKIDMQDIEDRKIGLSIGNTVIAGRVANDTLAMGIDRINLHEDSKNRRISIDSEIKIFIGTDAFGRFAVPFKMQGDLSFPEDDFKTVEVEDMNINFAHIPLSASGRINFAEDRAEINANFEIPECRISDLKDKYIVKFIPEAEKFKTDATLTIKMACNGDYIYKSDCLPPIIAKLSIPEATMTYSDLPEEEIRFNVNVDASTDSFGRMDIRLSDLNARANGLSLSINGGISDLTAQDPEIKIDGKIDACLDSLKRFIPKSLGLEVSGGLKTDIKGSAKVSQLNIYNFSESSISGRLTSESLLISMPSEEIKAEIEGLEIFVGPETKTTRMGNRQIRLVGISGECAKIDAAYKDAFSLYSTAFSFSAKNITNSPSETKDGKKVYPFGGTAKAKNLNFKDSEGTRLTLQNTSNNFRISQKRDSYKTPILTLTSRNGKIFGVYDINRIMLSGANIKAKAELTTFKKKAKMEALKDSLSLVYPGIPRDSLFRHAFSKSSKKGPRQLPDWLSEEDFRKQDINIALDKNIAKHFKEWDINGGVDVENAVLITPYFPLRNRLERFALDFTNDKVVIDSMTISSGASDISISGSLSGLKNSLLGRRGMLHLNMDIKSEAINVNELLGAYVKGTRIDKEKMRRNRLKDQKTLSDEEYMKSIETDSTEVEAATPLLVVPANVIAHIKMDADNISYSDLMIKSVDANVTMKERCLQLTDTHASTNMGEIDLEAFYSTKTKKDLKTGFSAEFSNITAEKALNLMPGLDTIVPLLKSFEGILNCELAATTQLDTAMNLLIPSMNGVIRISGKNLHIKNNQYFTDLAKTLMFKNKKEGHIDNMTVEGIIQDGKLEVFPFILDIDRYVLGLSGIQNMDMSYRYHASLIKSPLLIRFGVDLYGDDFDNMKFKIGKAKYKNTEIPTFTKVIDQTKINLVESINNIFDKGVESVIEENKRQEEIMEYMKKIGYVKAADIKTEELSEEEKMELEKELNIKTFEKK